MAFELNEKILNYLEDSREETLELLEALCKIPAPSNHEERRAQFCKNWLEQIGAEGVIIDSALNVIYPSCCEGKNDIIVFMAHTDTVFPDMEEPMPFSRDDKYIYSPGVGDDTACLVMMLMIIKYIVKNNLKSECGVLFVANSGEEGLGNLKGVKQIMKDYEGRVSKVYTFDGRYNYLVNRCVGSHRYKISFETEGGHSFGDFGNRNAICSAAELIHRLNKCEVPVDGDSKTTYNVGVIEGGTSVNTIAQNASFTYEYRSDSNVCIEKMKEFFEKEIEIAKADDEVKITVETIGIRPCGAEVDANIFNEMVNQAKAICEKYTGGECTLESGSTDANIPMSLKIPAICVGTYQGGGVHTREEYLEISSVPAGLQITAELILQFFVAENV